MPLANAQWEEIKVAPLTLTFDIYDRPQWRKCHWCGRDATHTVYRRSRLTGYSYEDNACEEHAAGWEK